MRDSYHPPGASRAPRGGRDLGPLPDEEAVMDSGLSVFLSEKGVSPGGGEMCGLPGSVNFLLLVQY